ncbi:hypothetical protein BGX26_005198, partial [Mortierella sp. AD094]
MVMHLAKGFQNYAALFEPNLNDLVDIGLEHHLTSSVPGNTANATPIATSVPLAVTTNCPAADGTSLRVIGSICAAGVVVVISIIALTTLKIRRTGKTKTSEGIDEIIDEREHDGSLIKGSREKEVKSSGPLHTYSQPETSTKDGMEGQQQPYTHPRVGIQNGMQVKQQQYTFQFSSHPRSNVVSTVWVMMVSIQSNIWEPNPL